MKKQLLAYAIRYEGEFNKIKQALANNEPYKPVYYQGKYLTILDAQYPKAFKLLKYPPYVIFYEGDLSLLERRMICIVGSRQMSHLGKAYVEECMRYLDSSYCIVSGLAKGIDGLAHQRAIETGRGTIACIGCGLDISYPKQNEFLYEKIKQTGLLLSEYPNGVKPLSHHFPWRNRLLAALGESIIVVEAKERSGTLITVNEALELGKDIYCFPYDYYDPHGKGCNMLIAQGSYVLWNSDQIKEI